ncbi:BCCT family transporter [Emcibacter sp. SYSU 3D8]|uniref:BCCT family transporter n=1 Tax=Emcibacter sp. SYSU 3D8 TaxID=3133969 RepID=UPI0031FEB474
MTDSRSKLAASSPERRRGMLSHFARRMLGDVGAVFLVSMIVILGFAALAALVPVSVAAVSSRLLDVTAHNFGWLYLFVTSGFACFAIFLAVSRFGTIRFGPDHEPPEFSYTAWLGMIFSAGMGVGLVFWGVAEPLTHFNEPPLGIGTPRSFEAAQTGMRYSFFHWGIHQWANFAIVGLSIAYVRFRHNSRGLISETFRPLIGSGVDGTWGKAIDILTVVSTVFGVATTLGLGALQLNSGVVRFLDVDYGYSTQLAIILGLGLVFLVTAVTPLEKGIRYVSNANMAIAAALLVAVAVLGPTSFIFGVLTQTLGEYLGNIVEMSLVTSPYSGGQWVEQWTMFYWAWGLSWAPFVGSFIARISRGRTIREFVLGVMIVPVALSMLWFSVFGGSAVYFELFKQAGIADAVANEAPSGLYVLLDQLPASRMLVAGTVLLVAMFVMTSANSATFILGMFTSKGVLNPTRFVRVFWGVMILVLAAALLFSGGLGGLQTISIITAFPFMLLMILIAFSLYRDLSKEFAIRDESARVLNARIEQFFLREPEREAAREAEEEVHPTAPEADMPDPKSDPTQGISR